MARKDLKARVRKRFLTKDQLRVGWDFSHATLTFEQGTWAPPFPLLLRSVNWEVPQGTGTGEPSCSGKYSNVFHFRVTFNRCGFTDGEGRGK